jgi:hypothetical protein
MTKEWKIRKEQPETVYRGTGNTMPKTKGQMTNNDVQNTTHNIKDRGTRTPLKSGERGGW